MFDVNKELVVCNFLGEWSEVVVCDCNYFLFVIWIFFNEIWGGGLDVYVCLVCDVYNIIKVIDLICLVNDVSGDNYVIIDIWSVYNYEQDCVKLIEQLKMEEGKEFYCNVCDKDFLVVYEG